MISIRSIQDYIDEDSCRWVPTHVMWADGLTKKDKQLCLTFQEWLIHPHVTLVEEKEKHQCEIVRIGPDWIDRPLTAISSTDVDSLFCTSANVALMVPQRAP